MQARTRRTSMAAALLLLAALVTLPAVASIEKAAPEEVGLSADRLKRIHEAIERHIDDGNITGAVTAATRRGRLAHLEAHGLMDVESGKAMTEDAIFKIMSMTKPIVGVAILMLMEDGKLRLRDPASRFIPELAELQVAVERQGGRGRGDEPPAFYTVPAERPTNERSVLGASHLAIQVDNIAELFQAAVDNGATSLNPPTEVAPGRTACYMQDPEGNWIELIELAE